jgi:hypothetical protein
MADDLISIVLRYRYSVFDKYYCTKNRGACVEVIIWLLVFMGQINFKARLDHWLTHTFELVYFKMQPWFAFQCRWKKLSYNQNKYVKYFLD